MAIRPRTGIFIGVAAAAVIAIGATVVVNSVQNGADDGSKVTWWVTDWDYDVATELVAEFEAENPDLTVEMVRTTGDTVANRVSVALDSGNVPDVITDSISRVPTYAQEGQLAGLDSLFGSEMPVDDFASGVLDAVTVDGEIYALPYRWATNALIYNPELFAAAGIDSPPATLEEFADDARTLTAGDVVGTAWPIQGDPRDLTLRFLDAAVSAGADIDTGTPKLSAESTAAALELLGQSIADGWASQSSFELDNTAIRELFLQGRIAMYPGGVFDVDEALSLGAPVATALLPGLDGPGTAQGVGWAHLVPAESDNLDAALRLTAFLGESESMARLTATFPARVSSSQEPRFDTPERQVFALQLAEHSIPAADDPRWTASLQPVHDQIQEVALGRVSVEEATAAILELWQQAQAE